MRRALPVLPALLAFLATPALSAEPMESSPTDPTLRPFGYLLGDVIDQRLTVPIPPGFRVDAKSLPHAGRADNWLMLHSVQASETDGNLQLHLGYQLTNAPRAVQTLFLPTLRLSLHKDAETRELLVGEQPYTAGPLTPQTVLARAGLDEMRPEAPAPLLETAALRQRLWLWAGLGLGALGWLLWRYALAPLLARRSHPFAVALRRLRHVRPDARGTLSESQWHSALRCVHEAIDASAQGTLTGAEVSNWLGRVPRYAPLGASLTGFFELSRQTFFGPGTPAQMRRLDTLLALCRAGRDIELAGGP